ncbi:YceI family protein [bacterium]|nr:YceI family protein [bacterium]
MKTTLITLAILLVVGSASAEEFFIEAGEENSLTFYSKAPMESFEGSTDQIVGKVSADLADLSAGVLVEVQVDMASMDTGMKLRNKHMCENHLETEEFPQAVFRAERVLKAPSSPLLPGGNADFVLVGTMTLHGITREIEAPVSVRCIETDGQLSLQISSSFQITLSDYEIKRPKFLVLKLNETQDVEIKLTAWEARK